MARILIAFFIVLVASDVAAAQGRGRGASNAPDSGVTTGSSVSVTIFTREHERIIREWFAQPANLKGLPPGLARKEQLPPGLQRQLIKNGRLPPGLEQKLHPIPVALESRLPVMREGYVRVVVGGNVLVMEVSTKTIVDILSDIF
jgi:hypothetical protein